MLLGCILVLASILRFYKIGHKAMWVDECFTVLSTMGEIPYRPHAISYDSLFTNASYQKSIQHIDFNYTMGWNNGNNFIHYLIVWPVFKLFGYSTFTLRAPSAVANLLLIVVVFFFVIDFFKNIQLALLASLLCAIEPFFIYFSQEGRAYNFAILFSFLSSIYFLRLWQGNYDLKQGLAYILFSLLAVLSHLFFVSIFIGQFFYVLLFGRKEKLKMAYWFGSLFLILSFIVFWVFEITGGDKIATSAMAASIETYKFSYEGYISKSIALFFRAFSHVLSLKDDCFYFTCLSVSLCFYIWIKEVVRPSNELKPILIFCLLQAILPILFISTTSLDNFNLFTLILRYASSAFPFIVLLFAFAILSYKKSYAHTFILSIFLINIVISVISIPKIYFVRSKEYYPDIAKKIDESYSDPDTVIYPALMDAQMVNVYMSQQKLVLQKVDTMLHKNSIVLQRAKGNEEIALFDFRGGTLRY